MSLPAFDDIKPPQIHHPYFHVLDPGWGFCGTKEFDGGGGADPNTGTGQSWGTSQNWRPDGTPISSDDVVFDNAFKATLQNVNLNAVNRVANSLTVDLTTNQTWNLGADAAAGNATLTLTTGSLTRNNEATNSSLVVIGATTGTGIGTGILTLATTAAGFTIANQDADASLLVQGDYLRLCQGGDLFRGWHGFTNGIFE